MAKIKPHTTRTANLFREQINHVPKISEQNYGDIAKGNDMTNLESFVIQGGELAIKIDILYSFVHKEYQEGELRSPRAKSIIAEFVKEFPDRRCWEDVIDKYKSDLDNWFKPVHL